MRENVRSWLAVLFVFAYRHDCSWSVTFFFPPLRYKSYVCLVHFENLALVLLIRHGGSRLDILDGRERKWDSHVRCIPLARTIDPYNRISVNFALIVN